MSEQDCSWFVTFLPRGEWTERVLQADSLADAAKLARAWIEGRLRHRDPRRQP